MKQEMVMVDSDSAATLETVQLWKSRNGHYYADEHAARYDGCTHVSCTDCQTPIHKNRTLCESCATIREKARYQTLPRQPYTDDPIYVDDVFLMDRDEVVDFCYDRDILPSTLIAFPCEPEYVAPIDPYDFYEVDRYEGGEISAVLEKTFDVLNQIIEYQQEILSWHPDHKKSVDLSTLDLDVLDMQERYKNGE